MRSPLDASNRSQVFSSSTVADDTFCMAFEWNTKNLYVGNKVSQTIEVVRTQGAQVCIYEEANMK